MASLVTFAVRRYAPTLVVPAKPTPHEFKLLSDIDDQHGLRFHISNIFFYPNNPSMTGRDPANVLKEGLAMTLVHYYPLAGRLKERPGGKLVVECTGELFVEADADVRLEQFGGPLCPPFPGVDELIHDVEGSSGIVSCPLILIQVTRLICGGFVLGLRINHTLCDAQGLAQFMQAVGEMACGMPTPSVQPLWARELLCARTPPRTTHPHPEYNEVVDINNALSSSDPALRRSFFFGPSEISGLRHRLPPHLRMSSPFDIITACVWRCRNVALGVDPQQEVRTLFIVTAREKFNPPLPSGYYGNAFVFPAAVSPAGMLCSNPLGYALELVKRAKSVVNAEYLQSVADLMVLKGRPHYSLVHTYLVSDLTRSNLHGVDLGWGKPVYGGPALGGVGAITGDVSFYTNSKNRKGEDGVSVPISLPAPAMERFSVEIQKMIEEPAGEAYKRGLIAYLVPNWDSDLNEKIRNFPDPVLPQNIRYGYPFHYKFYPYRVSSNPSSLFPIASSMLKPSGRNLDSSITMSFASSKQKLLIEK